MEFFSKNIKTVIDYVYKADSNSQIILKNLTGLHFKNLTQAYSILTNYSVPCNRRSKNVFNINENDVIMFNVAENDNQEKCGSERPEWALLAKITQHMETILFREKFLDWPDFTRVIQVKSRNQEKQVRTTLISMISSSQWQTTVELPTQVY